MYISADGLQAMHQEIVNDNVRRSEQRRMLKERKVREQETDIRAPRPTRRLTVTVLARAARALIALP